MKRLLVLLPLLLCAAACGTTASVSTKSPGSATESSPTAPPQPSKPSTYNLAVGQTVDMNTTSGDEWSVTVNSIKNFKSINQFEKPTAGQHFIVIDVTYQVTNGTADANPFDWQAKDPTGMLSPTDLANFTLHATTIEAPNKTRGTVVLEIPVGSGGTVVYSPGFSEKASWSFSAADVA
jgi:hypothetical protein